MHSTQLQEIISVISVSVYWAGWLMMSWLMLDKWCFFKKKKKRLLSACVLFTKGAHLHSHTSLQLHYFIEVLENSLVLLVSVLKTLPEHQTADDVGHSVVYQCLGIKRLALKTERKCSLDRMPSRGID